MSIAGMLCCVCTAAAQAAADVDEADVALERARWSRPLRLLMLRRDVMGLPLMLPPPVFCWSIWSGGSCGGPPATCDTRPSTPPGTGGTGGMDSSESSAPIEEASGWEVRGPPVMLFLRSRVAGRWRGAKFFCVGVMASASSDGVSPKAVPGAIEYDASLGVMS